MKNIHLIIIYMIMITLRDNYLHLYKKIRETILIILHQHVISLQTYFDMLS